MSSAKKITLLQLNDSHGYLEPHPEFFWSAKGSEYRTCGGYARISAIFQRVRRECGDAVIALDNGDTLHGTFAAVHSKGAALIRPLNRLAFDAWTGHWDFAYGVDRLRELTSRLSYPFLASNCYLKATGERAFPACTVIERAGLRVGVVGIAATIVDKTMPSHFSEGLRFTLGNAELPQHIRQLREHEKVDLVVVLSHLGFPQDAKLAQEIGGIDVLLSGHTHNRMAEPVVINDAIIIQSGCHGSFVGRLDIELSDGKVFANRHELIAVDAGIEPDAEMAALVEEIMGPHRSGLAAVVGHTEVDLHRNAFLAASMDDLLLQAVSDAAGTRVAFSNGWRYGAPVPKGPITRNDLWNMIPSNPPISVVEISGKEMRMMLEENLERAIAADPYRQMGGFPKRCHGVHVYAKLENPVGTRVQQMFVAGGPWEANRIYPVGFVTMQGVPPEYGRNRRDLQVCAIDALESCLAKQPFRGSARSGGFVAV